MTNTPTQLPKSDPPLLEARILGARLTFTDEAPERPRGFIAVHGVPGSVRDFRYLAPPLTGFARLIRVNLPGSGDSEPRLEALRSLGARAETVLALANHLDLRTFGLIGHSMGTGTALVTASMAPDRVTEMALIAPMGLRAHRGLSRSRTAFARIAWLLRVPVLRSLFLPLLRREYRRRGFPGSGAMSAEDYRVQFESFTAADFPLLNRAVKRTLPSKTLVAFADDDPLVEPAIPIELAAAIPGARSLRFPDGGHIIQKNRAEEIAAAIRAL